MNEGAHNRFTGVWAEGGIVMEKSSQRRTKSVVGIPGTLFLYTLLVFLSYPPGSFAAENMINLGTLGGAWSQAKDINNAGQVVGTAVTSSGQYHAFLFSDGTMTDIGVLIGEEYSHGTGINDAGDVVGLSSLGNFYYTNGTVIHFGYPPKRLSYTIARGVNNAGDAVGYYNEIGPMSIVTSWSFLFNVNSRRLIKLGYSVDAYGINDAGQVVGAASGSNHAFLYSDGTMTDLGTLPGGTYSHAFGINNAGQVVGYANTADHLVRAFLYSDGTMTDLGTLPGGTNSYAYGINDAGQVVGISYNDDSDIRAFLYSNGAMMDLGTPPGGTTAYATAINNAGDVVGYFYTTSGGPYAFLSPAIPILAVTRCGNGSGSIGSSSAEIDCGVTCAARFIPDTTVTLTAAAASGSVFAYWTGACIGASPTCTVVMSSDMNVTAVFEPAETKKVELAAIRRRMNSGNGAITSTDGMIDCGTHCRTRYYPNTLVVLSASPEANSTFTGWTGACSGTGACSVTMDKAKTVVATFAGPQKLTVSKRKTGKGGNGVVTSVPSGITCGSTCSAYYPFHDAVVLSASPEANSTFTGWTGACSGTGACSVTMDKAKTVVATFAGTQKLTVSKRKMGKGNGVVTSVPSGITCGSTCSAYYPFHDAVTLTATANNDSLFTGWKPASLNCPGTEPCIVTMDKARAVTAVFLKPGTGKGTLE